MNHTIEIFATLGNRLKDFGKDSATLEVMHRAMEQNEWFCERDILLAVEAIREEFLDKEKLQRWAAAYTRGAAKRVAIIMAGNIPLVGFYDLLCVVMAGHTALVKPSSKDKILTEYIIELLRDIEPTIAIEPYSDQAAIDMAIATGGDEAARHFRTRYANLPTIIRGSRHSLAVLDGKESKDEIEGLCRDIFSHNGLGCRNISLILLPRNTKLDITPPDTINPMTRGNYLQNKALKSMLGVAFTDLGGYIAVESNTFSDNISQINYYYYNSISEVKEWIAQNDEKIQCVVSNSIDHPRRVAFGRAQYPTLWDVADGVDVMKFLTQR